MVNVNAPVFVPKASFGPPPLLHLSRIQRTETMAWMLSRNGVKIKDDHGYYNARTPENTPRFMDDLQGAVDRLEGELMGKLENARLLVQSSSSSLSDPLASRDPRWLETGDRYILTMFRDYVHQVEEFGNPVMHVNMMMMAYM
ncbi:hypothetical protein ONZ45_g15146 [Pleurotus djamor]|nr:hypothetical protein ONZ45_g15146 [Pleurotus djamor]